MNSIDHRLVQIGGEFAKIILERRLNMDLIKIFAVIVAFASCASSNEANQTNRNVAAKITTPQNIFSMSLIPSRIEIGKKGGAPSDLIEMVDSVFQIEKVDLLLTDFYLLRLKLLKEGGEQKKVIFLKTESRETASILKDLIVSDTPYHFLYDSQSIKNGDLINLNAFYIWDRESNSVFKALNLISPTEKKEDQSLIDRILKNLSGQ